MPRRWFTGSIALSAVMFVTATLATPASATPVTPSLRVFTAQQDVTLPHYGNQPVDLDIGAYVAATHGTFQIDVTRANYRSPIEAAQIVATPSGTRSIPLPDGLVRNWDGLPWFLTIVVNDHTGTQVARRHLTFCPDSYDVERLSPNGPANPTFPQFCSSNPFTLGMVWGIDGGWAVNPLASSFREPRAKLTNGRYTITETINPTYAALFGIPAADATVTVNALVKKGNGGGCPPFCGGPAAGRSQGPGRSIRSTGVPVVTSPDPSTEPDLVALPAWGINIETVGSRDYLDFGATVWDRGPAPMVVEGFRQAGTSVMRAWEYFFDDSGAVVGRARAGSLKYDARPGHEHWHFQQFAQYQLLDANKAGIVYSDKEGFCLAPTDAIDLAVHGANWNPGYIGFGYSVCGSQTSIWTRETLPTGWGDTYFQGLPGQSFDITNLPNGTYYIAVRANPKGLLYERSTSNNVRYRRVILGGTPGARTVTVPPWNGIDTEGGGSGVGGAA
jgi:hypothetical protein